MPTYFRPARVDITEGGGRGGLVLIAAAVVAAAAVGRVHRRAHRAPGRLRRRLGRGHGCFHRLVPVDQQPQEIPGVSPAPTVRVITARPTQAIPAPRPRAIEAPRTVPAQVRLRDTSGAK